MPNKKYEEHMMYGDGKARKAETNAEHLSLKKKDGVTKNHLVLN